MKVVIQNLTRKDALSLLSKVQQNHCTSSAVQGADNCRFVTENNVTATIRPLETESGFDYSKNTFEIQSDYFNEYTLKSIIEA